MQHRDPEALKPREYDDPQGGRSTSIYIARRVGQRLLLALYMHRVVALGVLLALLVLGLFWLRAPRPGQAPVIGALPIPVSVQPLAASSGGIRLVLKEQNGPRELALDLDVTSAPVVARHQGVRQAGDQPQVYELLREVVQRLGGRIDHVIVSDVAAGMYAARVVVSIGGDVRVVRAKASDAAALALITGAPIFVENTLFEPNGPHPAKS
jgi:bifunctional DNase/RNase